MKREYDMRIRGVIGMLQRIMKKHGNVKVKSLQFGHYKNPRPMWMQGNGGLYKQRWNDEDILVF